MIRIEYIPTRRAGTITRAAVACDSCHTNGPARVCSNGGDHWDETAAIAAAESAGWQQRLVRNTMTHVCPVCQQQEAAAKTGGQLALFGGCA
jgi:Zn finger protein HypA/HybF involved in hydrogenase expression